MKKFITNTLTFLGIIIIYKLFLFTLVLFTLTDESKEYYGNVSYKRPKIILIGSSNLVYNYDYELMNKSFDDYDIIGCNLNEPSGLYPTIYKSKQLQVDSSDVFVICFPHSFYEKNKFFPIQNYMKTGVNIDLLMEFSSEFPLDFFKKLVLLRFDKSIELIQHIDLKKKEVADSNVFLPCPQVQSDRKYQSCWTNDVHTFFIKSDSFEEEYLARTLDYVSTTLAGKVLYRFPAIKKGEYLINEDRIKFLSQRYPFINDFESSIYEDKYWFNQWYHLNRCGRDLNTEKLIKELKNQGF